MTTIIKVEGMSCNHCKMAVERASLSIEGVESASVDLEKKSLTLGIKGPGEETIEKVKTAVRDAGYNPA